MSDETLATNDFPSREELIAAARAVGGAESADVAAEEQAAAERAAAPQADPGAAPAEAPPAEEEEPRIAALLKAREKAAAEREAARNHAEEMLRQAREESERIMREAREQAQRAYQAEQEALRQQFQRSPTAHLRQLGDPQEIADAVMMENTPQARALAKLQQEIAKAQQTGQTVEELRAELQALREEKQREEHQRQLMEARQRFLSMTTKEATPHLAARYDADEIFARGNQLAAQWRSQGLQLGRDFDFGDVAQYLERESKQRLAQLGLTPAQQVSAGAPLREPGNAPKVPANGPRTLSAAAGSERRTSPKPVAEMTPEEERQALIEEVAAARRANPGSTT